MLRKLKLDIFPLENAFDLLASVEKFGDSGDFPTDTFLDLSSGEVVIPESHEEAEEFFEDKNLLALEPLRIASDDYTSMQIFIETLDNGPAKDLLAAAIDGPRPFRKFKDIVHGGGDIVLRHAWHCYRQRREREAIVEWLEDHDIEPEWTSDIFQAPELPNKRPELIAAVLNFVKNAARLDNVRRISLLGSLTTDKPQPKDVDLLVEIADPTQAPLAPLAKAARKLRGATAQTGESRGADVFLADSHGTYLGRTCSWKECAPGLRLACEAQNCGAIEFLYDDLQNVTLPNDLIAEPPIDLWPKLVVRIDSVPDDLRKGLLEKLT